VFASKGRQYTHTSPERVQLASGTETQMHCLATQLKRKTAAPCLRRQPCHNTPRNIARRNTKATPPPQTQADGSHSQTGASGSRQRLAPNLKNSTITGGKPEIRTRGRPLCVQSHTLLSLPSAPFLYASVNYRLFAPIASRPLLHTSPSLSSVG